MKNKINSKLVAIALVTIALLHNNFSFAQPTIDDIIPDFNPEQQKALSKEFGFLTSAVTVFTGINSVSGGHYNFQSPDNTPDTTLDVLRVPYTHVYGVDGQAIRPHASILIGQSKVRASDATFSDTLSEESENLPDEINALPNNPDFVKSDSTSLSLGGGAQIQFTEKLKVDTGMNFIWTHIKRRYDYNNFLSALVGVKYDRELFNTSVESISYSPHFKIAYQIGEDSDFNVTPSTQVTYLSTYDLNSKSTFADFSADATIVTSTLNFNLPTNYTLYDTTLSVNPFIIRTDLGQSAQDGIGLWYFYDFGANFKFEYADKSMFFKSISLGTSYSMGDDFSGYRIGLTAEL